MARYKELVNNILNTDLFTHNGNSVTIEEFFFIPVILILCLFIFRWLSRYI